MLLKENVTKVPKGNFRRKLIREGFLKEIGVNRRDSEEDVREKILSAFSITNFVVLECRDGHFLSKVSNACCNGSFAINRRGCLYICEVSICLASVAHKYGNIYGLSITFIMCLV